MWESPVVKQQWLFHSIITGMKCNDPRNKPTSETFWTKQTVGSIKCSLWFHTTYIWISGCTDCSRQITHFNLVTFKSQLTAKCDAGHHEWTKDESDPAPLIKGPRVSKGEKTAKTLYVIQRGRKNWTCGMGARWHCEECQKLPLVLKKNKKEKTPKQNKIH